VSLGKKRYGEDIGKMRVLFAGATGLVGSALLPLLGRHDVTALGRRRAEFDGEQRVGPIGQWPELVRDCKFDVAISTLGTTIRQAGSQAGFAVVDRDAVLAIASAARAGGARQFVMVSSVGATASASNFYLKTKGEAEDGVRAMGFERIDIFRPGLLTGDRGGPARPFERIMMAVSPLTDLMTPSVLDQYRSIAARDVAGAIARALEQPEPGIHIHHNRDMLRDVASIG
jgi:uncharacterized protein YbjT (DUF2867 family)